MSIGQAAFSPDGRWFGYIHTDAANYVAKLRDREERTRAGTFSWDREHHTSFRNSIPSTLALVVVAYLSSSATSYAASSPAGSKASGNAGEASRHSVDMIRLMFMLA